MTKRNNTFAFLLLLPMGPNLCAVSVVVGHCDPTFTPNVDSQLEAGNPLNDPLFNKHAFPDVRWTLCYSMLFQEAHLLQNFNLLFPGPCLTP